MARERFSSEIAKGIVLAAAAGIVITAPALLFLIPAIGIAVSARDGLSYKNGPRRYRLKKTFEELRAQRFVKTKPLPDGRWQLVLTKTGKKKMTEYEYRAMKIPKPAKWDGKWRMVIFDIPQGRDRERELWRRKLHALGFYCLQLSVWIYPYPCKDQIDIVSEVTGVSPFVRIIEADDFEGSEGIKNFFFV